MTSNQRRKDQHSLLHVNLSFYQRNSSSSHFNERDKFILIFKLLSPTSSSPNCTLLRKIGHLFSLSETTRRRPVDFSPSSAREQRKGELSVGSFVFVFSSSHFLRGLFLFLLFICVIPLVNEFLLGRNLFR
jgi:hypothetical protein